MCIITDIACPSDNRAVNKIKQENYNNLRWAVYKLLSMKKVEVILIVIDALGTISTEIPKWLEKIGVSFKIGHLEKMSLLGTDCMFFRVLE